MSRFLGSITAPGKATWIVQGIPLDMTVSRLHGTSSAPDCIRHESGFLETFSFLQEKDLSDCCFCDIGDIQLPKDSLESALGMIEAVASRFFSRGKKIASFGGEHLVSFPVLKAASSFFPDLAVIHIDAHADLRRSFHGMKSNHATVMRLVAEECLESTHSLLQFGIRSGTREEYEWGRANTQFFPGELFVPLSSSIGKIGKRPVYLSLDIDAVDPSAAPGTGTPEPGGLCASEVLRSLLLMKELNVIGFDIVEVSPPLDVNSITAVLAAKIARECLIMWGGGSC